MTSGEEFIMFFAIRYALGRKTMAPSIVVEHIIEHWHELKAITQDQIKSEILKHERLYGTLGDECDKAEWYRIIAL